MAPSGILTWIQATSADGVPKGVISEPVEQGRCVRECARVRACACTSVRSASPSADKIGNPAENASPSQSGAESVAQLRRVHPKLRSSYGTYEVLGVSSFAVQLFQW
eukprot:6470444-Amphidinium_carterae.2